MIVWLQQLTQILNTAAGTCDSLIVAAVTFTRCTLYTYYHFSWHIVNSSCYYNCY